MRRITSMRHSSRGFCLRMFLRMRGYFEINICKCSDQNYLRESLWEVLIKGLFAVSPLVPDCKRGLDNKNINTKPSIVLVWTLWSSGFLKFSEWLTKSQWYHEMSTLMSSYNIKKQHNLALENVRKNSTHLSKSSSPVEPSSEWVSFFHAYCWDTLLKTLYQSR